MPTRSAAVLFGLALIPLSASTLPRQAGPSKVSYFRQVKPILQKRCQGCHQPASQGGKLILTTYEALRAGGASGPGIKPGDPASSPLVRFITGSPPSMPKNGQPLSKAEVNLIRQWISEGAKNDTPVLKDPINPANPPVYRSLPVLSAIAYSPDGGRIAVSGYREVVLHKSDGSGIVARLIGKSTRIESIAFSPDGKYLAAVGGAPARFGEVQFWETAANTLARSVELSYDVLYGASFSPDSKQLALGGADNSVRILSVPDGKTLVKFDNHSDWVFATGWTMPDVKFLSAEIQKYAQGTTNRPLLPEDTIHLLSTGRDRAIKLIMAKNGSFVDDINTHTSPFRALAVRPNSIQALVAGDDGIPRLYQIYRTRPRTMNQEDQSLVKTYEQQPAQINAVAFRPDGASFATGAESGEIRIYSTDDAKRLHTIKGKGPVFSLAYRLDGKQLAAAGFDGRIRLIDADSGSILTSFAAVPLQNPANRATSRRPIASE